MHFSASWCHWCKPLEKNVFAQPEAIQAIESQYVAVRMDYDKHRQIAKQYGVRGVPWDVIITPDGYWVADFNSEQTAVKYAGRINKIAASEAAKRNALYAGQPAPVQPPSGQVAAAPQVEDRSRRPSDDRYAEFFNNQQQQAPRVDPVAAPIAGQISPPTQAYEPGGAAANPSTSSFGQINPSPATQAPVFNAPVNMPGTAPAPHQQAPPSPAPSGAMVQPTFAMDGYCPVHLLESGAWVSGDRRWGAHHRGQTYLFVSEGCQKKFLANADRYAPALSGNDPVALVDRGQTVPGRREHGCYFGMEPNRRIVLFADEASYQTFSSNPQRYAGQIFAPPQR